MGKRAKQSDPLGPHASRVEKAKRSRAELPSWYFRLLSIRGANTSFDPTDPRDFDEDLSELEEESKAKSEDKSQREDCECDGEDSECDCRFSDLDDSSDDESERSYDGTEADFYYDLKAEREERKREKLTWRKDKDRQLEVDRSKEEEVRDAERSLKKVQRKGKKIAILPPPVKSLTDQGFRLFSSDHVNHFFDSGYYQDNCQWIEFIHPDDIRMDGLPNVNTGMLYGRLFLDGGIPLCEFGPFCPPVNATLRPMNVKVVGGKHKLSLHFLGDGYLKLRLSRDLAFWVLKGDMPAKPPPKAPKVFEYVGIWADPEKEKAEQEKAEMERKKIEMETRRRRSPSPRETWFELNHPMGAYYDPRYSVDW